MRYMLLIYSRESDWAALSEKDRGQMFAGVRGVHRGHQARAATT